MFTAIFVAFLTVVYVAMGKFGMSRLMKERSRLKPLARNPTVSVVIPAYRSEKTIAATLRSVSALDYPVKEVIVVNDYPDSTPKIARRHGARVIQHSRRMGKAEALNTASRTASGELIFFIDSDTVVDRGCLRAMVPWFSEKNVAAVMPKYLLKNNAFISRVASVENLLTFGLLRIHMLFGSLVGFRGCSVVIRRDIIKKNPWPKTLLEDNHLSATLASQSYRIIWEPRALVWTEEPETLREVMIQKTRWGEGAYHTFRHHWRFYLRSPQFIIFFFPYLSIGMLSIVILALMLFSLWTATLTYLMTELLYLFVSMYFHTLIFAYLGSRKLLPLTVLVFMTAHLPVMAYSYFKGLFAGMKRRMRKGSELHFKHW